MSALSIAGWVPCTGAEGPHLRFALWVQGCTLACPGCCNPGMWSKTGGRLVTLDELVAAVRAARASDGIEGVTLVGGEPLEQMAGVAAFARAVAAEGLGVIVFSGLELAEARQKPGFGALWTAVRGVNVTKPSRQSAVSEPGSAPESLAATSNCRRAPGASAVATRKYPNASSRAQVTPRISASGTAGTLTLSTTCASSSPSTHSTTSHATATAVSHRQGSDGAKLTARPRLLNVRAVSAAPTVPE